MLFLLLTTSYLYWLSPVKYHFSIESKLSNIHNCKDQIIITENIILVSVVGVRVEVRYLKFVLSLINMKIGNEIYLTVYVHL